MYVMYPVEWRHVGDALKMRLADGYTSCQVVLYGERDIWWNGWLPVTPTVKIFASLSTENKMYPWRYSDTIKQCVRMKKVLCGKRMPLVPKTLGWGSITFHRWYQVPRPLEVLRPTHRRIVSLLTLMLRTSWCWICWCLSEFIRAQVIGISFSLSVILLSNC